MKTENNKEAMEEEMKEASKKLKDREIERLNVTPSSRLACYIEMYYLLLLSRVSSLLIVLWASINRRAVESSITENVTNNCITVYPRIAPPPSKKPPSKKAPPPTPLE